MSGQGGYERQSARSNGRSYSLIFFILFINLYVFLLILDIPFFRSFRNFCFIAAIAIAGFNIFKALFRKENTANSNPRDLISLISKYIKINRKYLLVSILGLILAIAVISQIILLTSTPGSNIYHEALDDGNIPLIEIYGWDNAEQYFTNYEAEITTSYTNYLQENDIRSGGMDFSVRFGMQSPLSNNSNSIQNYYFESTSISEEEFLVMKSYPSFSSNLQWHDNMTLLVLRQEFIQFEIENDDFLSNLDDILFFGDNSDSPFTFDFDGYWIIQESDYELINRRGDDFIWGLSNSIVFAKTNYLEIMGNTSANFNRQEISGFVDVDSLIGMEAEEVLTIINNLVNEMYNTLGSLGYYGIDIYSPAEWRIQEAQLGGSPLRFLLLMISVPMLAIAMYLVYFSLNLVERRKQNLVAIMKIRGISSNQLQTMMFVESIIGALIATAVGMLVSLPWTQLILTNTELYGPDTSLYTPVDWYWKMPVIGIILAIDLNIFSILSISSTSVEEGEMAEEQSEPFWRRYYLDVGFTALGTIVWLTLHFAPIQPEVYFPLLLLAIWLLPLLVIGIPLLVSRFYSNFLTLISDFLWKREGNFIALATRNMRNNKFSASKLAVLLIIGMMFSFVAIGIPSSFEQWSVESSYYDAGADLSIAGISPGNTTHMEAITNQSQIESLTTIRVSTHEVDSTGYGAVKILGVDPESFSDAAFWKKSYADNDLSSLLDALKQDKILVQNTDFNQLEWKVGTNVSIQLDNLRLNHEIGSTFDYWPKLVNRITSDSYYFQELHVVMSMDNYQSYFNQSSGTVLAKLASGTNGTLVKENLLNDISQLKVNGNPISVNIISAEQNAGLFLQSSEVVLMFEMFDNLLIITIITSIIGVGYFSFTSLSERRREIGVFRAVGMVSKQIFMLLLIESVILVSTSILIGILAGSFVSFNLFLFLQEVFGTQVPRIRLYYPPILTIGFVIFAMLSSILAAALPARYTANKQTGSILRAE